MLSTGLINSWMGEIDMGSLYYRCCWRIFYSICYDRRNNQKNPFFVKEMLERRCILKPFAPFLKKRVVLLMGRIQRERVHAPNNVANKVLELEFSIEIPHRHSQLPGVDGVENSSNAPQSSPVERLKKR